MKYFTLMILLLGGNALILGAAAPAALPTDPATVDALRGLWGAMDLAQAQEHPRLGKATDGYVSFLGAPPGAPIRLDPALQGQSPETQAQALLTQFGPAFGIASPNVGFSARKIETDASLSSI